MFDFVSGMCIGVVAVILMAFVMGDFAREACAEVSGATSCELKWVAVND